MAPTSPARARAGAPDVPALKTTMGRAFACYEEVLGMLGGLPREWKYYGEKYGWQLKIMSGKKALLYLIPAEHSFRVALAVRENEREALLHSALPPEVTSQLTAGKKYAEGYPIRFRVQRAADLKPVKAVVGVVLASRSRA
jgi:hypothetical protein